MRGPDSARGVLPPGRGRGSSVSSVVCYLTGLSHVDPVRAGLFLGRFLNEELTDVPDIDLDFPRDVREQLIPRIHERYGPGALGAGVRVPDLPRQGRGARAREGAGAAADRDRAGGALGGRLGGRELRVGRRGGGWRQAGGLDALEGARAPGARGVGAAAPRLSALGRDGPGDAPAERALPDRAGGDGGAPDRHVGQGFVRGCRLFEDRPPGAGDALGGREMRRRGRADAKRAARPLAHPPGRSRGLRRDPQRRDDGRLSDRVEGADADAAAAACRRAWTT